MKPIVRPVPVNPPRRTLGRWAGRVPSVTDEQWAASDAAVAELFARTAEDVITNDPRFATYGARTLW